MDLLFAFATHGAPRIDFDGVFVDAATLRSRVGGAVRALEAMDVGAGDRVAMVLPHGVDAPVWLLACWWVGAVAVPLDTHHPPQRLAELLDRSGARALLVAGRRGAVLGRRLAPGVEHVVVVDATRPEAGLRQPPRIDAEAPAIVLWTSGSTGPPKGVTASRRAVDIFVSAWRTRLGIDGADRVAWTAALSFDLSLLDLGVALSAGATLVPVPERLLPFPEELTAWLRQEAVTRWYTVPSLMVRAVDAGLLAPPLALRSLLYAGEPMAGADASRLRAALPPDVALGNLFGPTETNVSCAYLIPTGWRGDCVPIGPPCDYLEVALVQGEIVARGGSVMSGYWGEPARARWIERGDGAPWLRTGDRARWREDGSLEFLGRTDRLLKVRGFRVEPEEVERALEACPGVVEAAVGLRAGELTAWVVGGDDRLADVVAASLPAFAVPTRFVALDALPRTARGKVDHEALAAR